MIDIESIAAAAETRAVINHFNFLSYVFRSENTGTKTNLSTSRAGVSWPDLVVLGESEEGEVVASIVSALPFDGPRTFRIPGPVAFSRSDIVLAVRANRMCLFVEACGN